MWSTSVVADVPKQYRGPPKKRKPVRMSTPSQQTLLAELLDHLHLSQAELARRSRTWVTTIARATRGEQASAAVRARIVAALNAKRAELQQPELAVSDGFPLG